MDNPDDDYLPKLIGILDRLQAKSAERGQAMLSFLLDLAKTEAQDELRQSAIEAGLRASLRESSTVGSWR